LVLVEMPLLAILALNHQSDISEIVKSSCDAHDEQFEIAGGPCPTRIYESSPSDA
jgi:hypothetical protein